MSRMKSANIVMYKDCGMAWTKDVCWIVMEYIEGDSLDAVLQKGLFSEVQAIQVYQLALT